MANLLPSLEVLDVEGDSASIGSRWEKWKRALLIYIDAAEIQSQLKKRAILLHMGGTGLQEIYYNLPGAHVETGESVFTVAIQKLDEFFLPKQNRVYERHIFRLLRQEEGETFEKFLLRLRKQADRCNFIEKDDHLIDQITEKCTSSELRKKILTVGDNITLEKIVTEAKTLEVVNKQLENYGNKKQENDEVNAIIKKGSKQNHNQEGKSTHGNKFKRINCSRCGSTKHGSDDSECPARRSKCYECGKNGHFRICCKAKKVPVKRKIERNGQVGSNSRNEYSKKQKIGVDYVFNVDDDATIDCSIGGIQTNMLIDSGCKVNLITTETWKFLKEQGVEINTQISNPDKTLFGYGSTTPLNVKGSVETTISISNRKTRATLYIISGGTRDLLGKETATKLGVLKMGIDINTIEGQSVTQPFPKFKDVLVEIPIDTTVKPVSQPYRRIPIPIEEKVENKIKELLDRDIIEEVHGPSRWVSPVVPILKENGDIRLCVDMRAANTAIMRENHPLPCMDKLLPKIGKAKYFSKLDIKDAFHQLELHPDSRHITTFITAKGLYQYKRLMFGISCAPETFQKALERILVKCEGVINFIDDILVFGDDEKEHDMRLEKVQSVLHKHNVLLNREKCLVKVSKVDFLGHELTPNGVRPLNKYIDSIKNFRTPATIEELQSFLGLVNYINKWIPNLATRTEPLKELLRKKLGKHSDIQPLWKQAQASAFDDLKNILSKIQSLGYYDVGDKTQVIADASPVGLGAVLIQIDAKGPRIIAYGNRTLNECERKYSQTEKEALALVWSVEHFNIFLFGKEFDLITDHKPLEILFGPKSKPCARIERWVLRLQSYKYKVMYKPGKTNIADSLSRLCVCSKSPSRGQDIHIHQIVEQSRPQAIPMRDIIEFSGNDKEINLIKKGIYENNWDETVKNYKIFENELCFYGKVLLRGNRIVIPQILQKKVLDAAHEGHPGIVAMKGRLRSKVWWPRIDKDVERLVKACKSCTLVGLPNPPTPMKRRELPLAPWVDVAMDLLGPLPNQEHLLVVIDYYSRYKEVKITKAVTSTQIINLLKEIFSRLGYPVSITVDNGKQFVSKEFRSFCNDCNIKIFNTVPYWPQQNGEVERQNRDILKRLKIGHMERKDLRESLWEYLIMYNSTPHSTTGRSPSELFFGRQNRDKIPSLEKIDYSGNDAEVRDRDRIQKEKGKEYGDKRRGAIDPTIKEGDKVYVKDMEKGNKLSSNFNPAPHTVEKAHDGDISVRNDRTGQVLRRNVVHLKKIEGQWTTVPSEDRLEENIVEGNGTTE